MSHDRGCSCGREKWEYRECVALKGDQCSRYSLVATWGAPKVKPRIRVKAKSERVDATG
jgi:hypothetical protein